jgi:uncharacterized protein (AIM24 family)
MATNRIVLNGRGPAVRFKTKGTGSVRVVSHGKVTKVALDKPSEVRFRAA